MDDQTPEMEELTQEMRAAMAAWVADPNNSTLRQKFRDVDDTFDCIENYPGFGYRWVDAD